MQSYSQYLSDLSDEVYEGPDVNPKTGDTSQASLRLRALADKAAAKKKSASKKPAAKKAAAQGGSVMIDKSGDVLASVVVKNRILGIDFPEWISPWMIYAILGVGGILLGKFFLGRRRSARNPFGWALGEDDDDRPARAGARLESHRDPLVRKAARFRREFHWGIPARKLSRRKISDPPKVAVELGELSAVTYKTKKRGETANFFQHEFEARKPRLVMDVRNKKLHIVGGGYTVTADGITG